MGKLRSIDRAAVERRKADKREAKAAKLAAKVAARKATAATRERPA